MKELWRFQTTEAFGGWSRVRGVAGVTVRLGGHVEKSQSEMESSKAAGKVKRAVELQEAFIRAQEA